MKRLLLLSILTGTALSYFACQEQQNFKITAKLDGFSENSKVILLENGSGKILDSTWLKNGSFQFKGQLNTVPTELRLVLESADKNEIKSTTIFIGNETITIQGHKEDFPAMLEIEGSLHQNLKSELEKATDPFDNDYDANIQKMIGMRNENKWNDSLQNVYWGKGGVFQKIDDTILNIQEEFVAKNINTHYGLKLLNGMKYKVPKAYIQQQFNKVDASFQTTVYGKALQIYLNSEPLKIDDKFYNFKAENQTGDVVEFSQFFNEEKYVLLEFYSPHCGWCKMALPEIKKLAAIKNEKLKVVTFNVDKNKQDWLKTNKDNKISWPSLWDKNGRYSETYTKYSIQGTPTYYLFNSEGYLIKKWIGFDENTRASIEAEIH